MTGLRVRPAAPDDLQRIHRFADVVVHDTYDRLVDRAYADDLVATWWTPEAFGADVSAGRVLVATAHDAVVGLAHLGEWHGEPVMWKLYVSPDFRGRGLGVWLVDELIDLLPPGTRRLRTEHIVANERAGRFYEREGFAIDEIEGGHDDPAATVWRSKELDPMWRELVAAMERSASVEARVTASIALGLAIEPIESVIDIGCGVGAMTVALARPLVDADIVAADSEPAMRLATRRRLAELGLADRVVVTSANVQVPTSKLAPADLVWASLVVHHTPDQEATLRVLHDLVAPRGRLALAEGGLPGRSLPWDLGIGRPGLEVRLDAAQDTWFSSMRSALPGSVRTDAGWPTLLRRAGFTDVSSRSVLLDLPAPLDETARAVVADRLCWASDRLAGLLSDEDVDTLRALLDEDGPHFIGRRDDTFVLSAQTVHVARR